MKWISEGDELPKIAEHVLLAKPRQHGEFWDIMSAQLLVDYDGVVPVPVKAGSRWPTAYWWNVNREGRAPVLVTGNSWWARLDGIPLPPGAEHKIINGYHCIVQPTGIWVGPSR